MTARDASVPTRCETTIAACTAKTPNASTAMDCARTPTVCFDGLSQTLSLLSHSLSPSEAAQISKVMILGETKHLSRWWHCFKFERKSANAGCACASKWVTILRPAQQAGVGIE